MKKICLMLCFTLALAASLMAQSGFHGKAIDKRTKQGISNLLLVFESTLTKAKFKTITNKDGGYKIELAAGTYNLIVNDDAYELESSPNLLTKQKVILETSRTSTLFDIFLQEKFTKTDNAVTTVLLVRHAEKAPAAADDRQTTLKSPEGFARAQDLKHVCEKAGVSVIYTTEFLRTQQTAQPTATALGKQLTIQPNVDVAVSEILGKHKGKVILVVGHQPSVPEFILKLGGGSVSVGDEFDNLFIVTIYASGKTKTINLQYGQ